MIREFWRRLAMLWATARPEAIVGLAELANHPDVRVRRGVVFGLMAHKDDLAIRALIELSTDEDP